MKITLEIKDPDTANLVANALDAVAYKLKVQIEDIEKIYTSLRDDRSIADGIKRGTIIDKSQLLKLKKSSYEDITSAVSEIVREYLV